MPQITSIVKVRFRCPPPPLSPVPGHCLQDKGPNHVSLWIHPNVLVFTETRFSHILKTGHAVTFFPLTGPTDMCYVQNQPGFITIPACTPGLCPSVSCAVSLKPLIHRAALSPHRHLRSLCPTFLFPRPYPRRSSPLLASSAPCPYINPKSFVPLPGLFSSKTSVEVQVNISENQKQFGNRGQRYTMVGTMVPPALFPLGQAQATHTREIVQVNKSKRKYQYFTHFNCMSSIQRKPAFNRDGDRLTDFLVSLFYSQTGNKFDSLNGR